ncbi:MAG: hypothetical protein IPP86_00825 [Bacteroidetes bacterium]|nr:hypothetical protein [Bacteroidota bacterium]
MKNFKTFYQSEKDSIAFLGLMALAYKNFDYQFIHTDQELTHSKGLNIFSCIIDNSDGDVLALQQNQIHNYCNPLLHAEQLSLNEAINKLNLKRPRVNGKMSVENYYRTMLFNDPTSYDEIDAGATIYTTLEPCPFCTSALLVCRMKRIVFIIPDSKFGNSFNF